jgi:hypothetical protein
VTTGRASRFVVGLSIVVVSACAVESTEIERDLSEALTCESPVPLAVLPDELNEASGIARDPGHADLFWIHNDSGNDLALYAFDGAGSPVAVVPVVGASNRDIEDLAVGPCATGDCLYVGDIGDNLSVRRTVSVHRLPAPDVASSSPISPEVSWQFEYEDGPRDSEALAVDGTRSELVVISKGRTGEIVLYTASIPGLRQTGAPNLLRRVGRLPLPLGSSSRQLITAADISPDGSRLAVRSYTTVYEFEWSGAEVFDTTAAPKWTSVLSTREPQGEGLTWDVSGESFYLVGERYGSIPPLISRVDCLSEPRE